jgi:hypothetical protein
VTRTRSAICFAGTIALGVASRRIHLGFALWDKSLGDALYTVMIYFAVACVRPSLSPRATGAIALGFSLAIETFQLTGIPARLPALLRFALGTTFAWHDVACYFVGALVVTAADAALRTNASTSG